MKPLQRTSWILITGFIIAGFGLGSLTEVALSAAGNPPLVPPYSLPATLITAMLVVLGFAISIRRSVRGTNKKMVNPFVAIRVLAAAKASILAGALFTGFALGIIVYFAARTVPPQPEAWWPVVVTFIAAVAQLAGGLVAEYLCRVPPTDTEGDESDARPEGAAESPNPA